jgi:transcription initiation factor TFIIIB Brf1 subunit/transcription initiation factor TFIIB
MREKYMIGAWISKEEKELIDKALNKGFSEKDLFIFGAEYVLKNNLNKFTFNEEELKKYFSKETIEKAKELLEKILNDKEKMELIRTKSKNTVLAGLFYVASALARERKTQKEIAEIFKTTEASIRNTYTLFI